MRHFNDWLGAYLEYTNNTQAPEQFLRWGGISVLAAALERKTWVQYNQSIIYPNLYVMFVGPSGISRKSSSAAYAVDLIKRVPGIAFAPEQATPAAFVTAMVEAGGRKTVSFNRIQYQNSSVYAFSSEAVMLLKESKSGSMVEMLTDLFDCNPGGWHYDVAWEKRTVGRGSNRVFNPCVNLLACSTTDWLSRIIKPSDISGGFFSRVVFVVQRYAVEEAPTEWVDDTTNDKRILSMRTKLIEDLTYINSLKGQFIPDSDTRELHTQFMRENHNFIQANQGHKYISYYARKPFLVLKMCQSISAARSDALIIKPSDWHVAKKLVEEQEEGMDSIFITLKQAVVEMNMDKVWHFIKNKEYFTMLELQQNFGTVFTRDTMLQILRRLSDSGKIAVLPGNHHVLRYAPIKPAEQSHVYDGHKV